MLIQFNVVEGANFKWYKDRILTNNNANDITAPKFERALEK